MLIIAVFIVMVFLYSLLSRTLEHTIITAPILFTAGGVALILAVPGLSELNVERESFLKIAEIGLVMLLFTDATHVNMTTLQSRERMPLRLLSIGMLLTILLGALIARLIFPSLTIWEAGILSAILAPTDAGLGQVIVQSPKVPLRIRQALNVEAGLNDGLSVPFLMFFIVVAKAGTDGGGQIFGRFIYEQLGMGALVGVVIGLIGGILLGWARKKEMMAEPVQQLGLVTIPAMSMLACEPVGGSMFIAAFVAGLSVQYGFRDACHSSTEFTEGWGQLFDYFIFFFFGLSVTLAFGKFTGTHLFYAIASLTLVRMLPVALALIGTRLSAATMLFMGWFGPRGLASIVLGLVFLEEEAHLPGEETIKLAVMVTVMLSIFLHGFTALPGINRYARKVAELDADAPERRE